MTHVDIEKHDEPDHVQVAAHHYVREHAEASGVSIEEYAKQLPRMEKAKRSGLIK